uniref:Uncharacterized protein n=1 Tax=Euplotes crassus TaxID=5936 RepID=A0A7S3KN83_EUPCR|mmetsp:Transcript_36526/g.36121  ORF Transcript_36526/g.36121 Transcript_36526/m.36121 type:complete len:132 (+) Transcript_36526:303-698(+)|eukprot:CAMPEP_0197004768 /NCGR_PEP_ID=MMETSP1380-20130617/25539_1 /TAXON_ID=5936 /ORGANISM="Euplotes crassus, Strain CT5" /LENGTH=131 /DNA_ID=CAMNT_0042423681 /DNA_START=467 /DNA_END=862 /DNA_ORIENTATION=+
MMGTSSISILTVEEVIEDMLFLLWCSLQYLRIIMFFKHQKDAKNRAQRLDMKHFYADSIQDNEDKIFIEDIEFNKDRDVDIAIGGFFKNVSNPRDKPQSVTEDIELENFNSRSREKDKFRCFDDNGIQYTE